MNAKTEELLYFLLWGAETLSRPTLHNLTESFEGWAYRRGFRRALATLERRQLLERQPSPAVERIYRLTEKGRMAALGGRDPEAQWNRPWDGTWRLVVFDVPLKDNSARMRLRRWLKERGFGCVQRSVWISPDPLDQAVHELSARGDDPGSLLTWEARPGAGEGDSAIVQAAWDFREINRRYEACAQVLRQMPTASGTEPSGAKPWQEWGGRERLAWLEAISADPLLPRRLLPAGYLGQQVWRERAVALGDALGRRGR